LGHGKQGVTRLELLAANLHHEVVTNGGFTFEIVGPFGRGGVLSRPAESGYAVSGKVLVKNSYSDFEPNDVLCFLVRVLQDKNAAIIGGWYDEASDTVELSTTQVCTEQNHAQIVANSRGERYIFDLKNKKEIPVTNCGLATHPFD